MIWKRNNGGGQKAARKSLMERLVIVDADETAAEAFREEPEDSEFEEYDSGRKREIPISAPSRRTIRVQSFDPRVFEEKEIEKTQGPRPQLHNVFVTPESVTSLDDALAQARAEEAESFEPSESSEAPPERNAWEEEKDFDVQTLDASEVEDYPRREVPREKTFDILDRAKEQDNETPMVRIVYKAPKIVSGLYTPPQIGESTEHKEAEFSEPEIFSESEKPEPSERSQESSEPDVVVVPVSELVDEAVEEKAADEEIMPEVKESMPQADLSENRSELNDLGSAIAEGLNSIASSAEAQKEENIENADSRTWESRVEDAPEMPRMHHFDRILFPEEYFYARNGAVLKSAEHLRQALGEMDDDTFAHHAKERGVNDFANWMQYVFAHSECARRLEAARSREEMVQILSEYL